MLKITLEDNHITFEGEIVEGASDQVLQVLNRVVFSQAKIFLHIKSEGGIAKEGFKIYTALKSACYLSPGLVISTIGYDHINSTAILIFLAGKDRFIEAGSRFAFHEVMNLMGEKQLLINCTKLRKMRSVFEEKMCFCRSAEAIEFFEAWLTKIEQEISFIDMQRIIAIRKAFNATAKGQHICQFREDVLGYIVDQLKEFEKTQDGYVTIISQVSGLPASGVTKLLLEEKTLTAAEALNMKIATHSLAG